MMLGWVTVVGLVIVSNTHAVSGDTLLRPVLKYVSGGEVPVIGSATENIFSPGYGFEGGQCVKVNGTYHLFTAEFKGWPVNSNMMISVWTSQSPMTNGSWHRETIIAQSTDHNGSCTGGGLDASPWAPFPIYDQNEQRWHVLWVGYSCDLSWVVRAGIGNIFGAVSKVSGRNGITGPYEEYGIIIGPNATNINSTKWGDLSQCNKLCLYNHDPGTRPPFCDTVPCRFANGHTGAAIGIGPFTLLDKIPDATYAAFVGLDHNLAWAPSPRGPWTIGTSAQNGENMEAKFSTMSSPYNENPVVSQITTPNGDVSLIAVFDTVSPSGGWQQVEDNVTHKISWGPSARGESYGFGMSYSLDGRYWMNGVDVALPKGCRTPLGLIQEPDGSFTLMFTRRFDDCAVQTLAPGSRGDAFNSRTMCANVYAAKFVAEWVPWCSNDSC